MPQKTYCASQKWNGFSLVWMCSPGCDNSPGGMIRIHCIRFATAMMEFNMSLYAASWCIRTNLEYTALQKTSSQKCDTKAHTAITLVYWSPADVSSMDRGEASIWQTPWAAHRSEHRCGSLDARNMNTAHHSSRARHAYSILTHTSDARQG
jgi:hypothetical protein